MCRKIPQYHFPAGTNNLLSCSHSYSEGPASASSLPKILYTWKRKKEKKVDSSFPVNLIDVALRQRLSHNSILIQSNPIPWTDYIQEQILRFKVKVAASLLSCNPRMPVTAVSLPSLCWIIKVPFITDTWVFIVYGWIINPNILLFLSSTEPRTCLFTLYLFLSNTAVFRSLCHLQTGPPDNHFIRMNCSSYGKYPWLRAFRKIVKRDYGCLISNTVLKFTKKWTCKQPHHFNV